MESPQATTTEAMESPQATTTEATHANCNNARDSDSDSTIVSIV